MIVLTGQFPGLELTVEETCQSTPLRSDTLSGVQLLTSHDFHGTQAVLVQVVGIDLLHTQGSITVSAPTTTEV